MSFYANMADLTLQKIKQFGVSAPIRRTARHENPVTGEVIDLVPQAGSIQVLVLPAAPDQAGDMVEEKTRTLVAAAKGAPFEPKAHDLVVIASTSWEVVSCTSLAPAGIPILYRMEVKLA